LGSNAQGAAARRAARSAVYRAERARVGEYHAIAKLVVHRRTMLGISQRELARRVATSETAISRLESGRHATNVRTLRRVFEALGSHLVVGYEVPRSGRIAPHRELVAV
jgi:transcriptional regulator with XRE-family HTH domain